MSTRRPSRTGFTLIELMVVIGLISVLSSLLLPVLGKARAAANASVCLSNLRQMGMAWTMYVAETRGRMPDYIWSTPMTPNVSWEGYWTGVVDRFEKNEQVILCPSASAESPFTTGVQRGYGTSNHAWSGRSFTNGCAVKFNPSKYRVGSYAYNRYLTVDSTMVDNLNRLTLIRSPSTTPLLVDSTFSDVRPLNQTPSNPVDPPTNLTGGAVSSTSPEHWRFLIARHGRAVNVCMADGSAHRVPLEEMYQLTWTAGWSPYRLELPTH
jgi:prepilin-type N-terminal cleavage/methylation domain-containing protein/prepilin-type processing-associated H-X9-DG protein